MARDVGRMAQGLRGWLKDGAKVTRVVALSTGHSNETYLVEGIDRILRMPPSEEGLLPPYDMARQHAILDAVGKVKDGPPVPKMFELCTDPTLLGDPFFLMEKLEGEAFDYAAPEWLVQSSPDVRDAMSRQWVNAVVSLHRLPVQLMPPGTRTVQDEIQHWRRVAIEAEAGGDLVPLLDELQRNPPASSGPVTPLHGDPKQGNCFWKRGHLQALLDWEMAGIGEPLTDLGYMLQFYDQGEASFASAGFDLEGWWQRDRVIAEWEKGTGRKALDMRRYEALAMCKIAAIIALGYHLSRTGRASDPRFAAWGAVVPGYVALARRRAEMK